MANLHHLCKPITLLDLQTGKTHTWPSRYMCASDINSSQVCVSALATGKQKTINGRWVMFTIKEDYQPIDMEAYLEEKAARDKVAEIQVKRGRSEVQDVQKYNNTTAAIFLGVQEINNKLSGWDGRKDGFIPFEQKCNGLMTNYNLNGTYQDTSDNKLDKLADGGLACNTAYIANGWMAYMVVYNTKMIANILKYNRNNARKSGVVSLPQILDAGGKIVACQYGTKETYTDIIRHYPSLRRYLSKKDIHSANEAKKIANEMAYWVEPAPLW